MLRAVRHYDVCDRRKRMGARGGHLPSGAPSAAGRSDAKAAKCLREPCRGWVHGMVQKRPRGGLREPAGMGLGVGSRTVQGQSP